MKARGVLLLLKWALHPALRIECRFPYIKSSLHFKWFVRPRCPTEPRLLSQVSKILIESPSQPVTQHALPILCFSATLTSDIYLRGESFQHQTGMRVT